MYVTLNDLLQRYGEARLIDLSDRTLPPAGGIDMTVIDRAIADAAAVIDAHCRTRYDLPFNPVPPILTDIAGAIVFYKLHRDIVPPKEDAEYKEAIAYLREIARGHLALPVKSGAATPSGQSAGAEFSGAPRLFSRETLGGF